MSQSTSHEPDEYVRPPNRRGAVPATPILSRQTLALRGASELPTLLDDGAFVLGTSGRAALGLALAHLGIVPGDEVLLPAYHCIAMVGPIVAAGGVPIYYRLRADLTVDPAELRSRVSSRARAVVIVHYFGFIQDLSPVRAVCDEARLSLIEDCAHAFYGVRNGVGIGRAGDYAVGSLVKFFPVFDGGCLVSYRQPLHVQSLGSCGVAFNAKAALNMLERGRFSLGRSIGSDGPSTPGRLRKLLKRGRRLLTRRRSRYVPSAGEGGYEFDSASLQTGMSWPSRLVSKYCDHGRVIARRRAHYRAYLDALSGLRGGQPLYDSLSDGVVPYVFPYVLRDPERSFEQLWSAGIPLFRWEGFAGQACETSERYRSSLIQFPCHQELSDAQMAWLAATARSVLRR